MPKIIKLDKRQQLKLEILKLLSVDGRASIQEIARKINVPKTTAYNLFLETEKEYGLKFVPEIEINNIWKYELVRLSREGSKREVLTKTIDKMHDIGFEEYVIFLKFTDKIPDESKIRKILETSHMPQFAAILHGQYDLVIYAISRSYQEVNRFLISVSKQLLTYEFESDANKIERTFGYFPVRQEFLNQIVISDNYKKILSNFNKNGRVELEEIRGDSELKSLNYTFDKLKRTEILKAITYYETHPKNVINMIIQVKVLNYNKYFNSRKRWFGDFVISNKKFHNEYTFMCDISNPQGCLIFCNFENNQRAELFFSKLKKNLKGVKLEHITLSKTIFGAQGTRNFDMNYTEQKKALDLIKSE